MSLEENDKPPVEGVISEVFATFSGQANLVLQLLLDKRVSPFAVAVDPRDTGDGYRSCETAEAPAFKLSGLLPSDAALTEEAHVKAKVVVRQYHRSVEALEKLGQYRLNDVVSAVLSITPTQSPLRSEEEERRGLCFDLILSRALSAILRSYRSKSLSEDLSKRVEAFAMTMLTIRKEHVEDQDSYVNLADVGRILADLSARILGLLSAYRFEEVTEKLTASIQNKVESSGRVEAIPVVRGLSRIRLNISEKGDLERSTKFLATLLPSFRNAKKLELKHVFCDSLARALSPLSGAERNSHLIYKPWDDVLFDYYEKAAEWSRKSKHTQATIPLMACILCCHEREFFLSHFRGLLEELCRHIGDPSKLVHKELRDLRHTALEALKRILHVYLSKFAEGNRSVFENLHLVAKSVFVGSGDKPSATYFLPTGPRGSPSYKRWIVGSYYGTEKDESQDLLVEILTTIAQFRPDFAVNNIIMELINEDAALQDQLAVAMRALVSIAWTSMRSKEASSVVNKAALASLSGAATLRSSPVSTSRLLTLTGNSKETTPHAAAAAAAALAAAIHDVRAVHSSIEEHVPRLNQKLTALFSFVKGVYGPLHYANPGLNKKLATELLTKEQHSGLEIYRCFFGLLPVLIPSEVGLPEIMFELARSTLHMSRKVREDAGAAVRRIVAVKPTDRHLLVDGFVDFTLSIPDTDGKMLCTAMGSLVRILELWTNSVDVLASEEGEEEDGSCLEEFRATRVESLALLGLCSQDKTVRAMSFRLLDAVRKLFQKVDDHAAEEANSLLSPRVMDVIEEIGYDVVSRTMDSASMSIIGEGGASKEGDSILEHLWQFSQAQASVGDQQRWSRCLGEITRLCLQVCPLPVTQAWTEAYARVMKMLNAIEHEGAKGGVPDHASVTLMRNYSVFACAGMEPRLTNKETGARAGAGRELFWHLLRLIRHPHEPYRLAAITALGKTHIGSLEILFEEGFQSVEDEVFHPNEWEKAQVKGKRKHERDNIRFAIASIYRLIAESLPPSSLLPRENDEYGSSLRQKIIPRFQRFIDAMHRFLSYPLHMTSIQYIPLRTEVALFVRAFVVEGRPSEFFVDRAESPRRRSDDIVSVIGRKLRIVLFHLFTRLSGFGPEGRESIEETVHHLCSLIESERDPNRRHTLLRVLGSQVSSMRVASASAVAALLKAPLFLEPKFAGSTDGPVFGWISSLALFGTKKKNGRVLDSGSLHDNVRAAIDVGIDPRVLDKIATQALDSFLVWNPQFLDLVLDECYKAPRPVAKLHFRVLVDLHVRQVLRCDVNAALILSLHKLADHSKRVRELALQWINLLQNISASNATPNGMDSFSNALHTTVSVAVTSGVADLDHHLQASLSRRLASEFAENCIEVVSEARKRIYAMDPPNQRRLISILPSWLTYAPLPSLVGEADPKKISSWDAMLQDLVEMTQDFGLVFPEAIENVWSSLARGARAAQRLGRGNSVAEEHIPAIIDFLLASTHASLLDSAHEDSENAERWLNTAKSVSVYLCRVSGRTVVNKLVNDISANVEYETISTPEHPPAAFDLSKPGNVLNNKSFARESLEATKELPTFAQKSGPSVGARLERRASDGDHYLAKSLAAMSPLQVSEAPVSDRPRPTANVLTDEGASGLAGEHLSTIDRSSHLLRDLGDDSSVSRLDVAILVMSEVAYEADEELRPHIPVLLTCAFTNMDRREPVMFEHAKKMLANLLHSLVVRHGNLQLEDEDDRLGGNGRLSFEHTLEATALINQLFSNKMRPLWKHETVSLRKWVLPSCEVLATYAQKLVSAFHSEVDLRYRWGKSALQWAAVHPDRHIAGRAHQLYRALLADADSETGGQPFVTCEATLDLLESLSVVLAHPSPEHIGSAIEILMTLQDMVDNISGAKLILLPQILWGGVAMLHTPFIHVYGHVVSLLQKLCSRLALGDQFTQHVLFASMPRDWDPPFKGIQPLVLKGLCSSITEARALELLRMLISMPCDMLVDPSRSRVLMCVVAFLPYLCLALYPTAIAGADAADDIVSYIAKAIIEIEHSQAALEALYSPCGASVTSSWSETDMKAALFQVSNLDPYHTAQELSASCEGKGYTKLAKILARFSRNEYKQVDAFLMDLRKPLAESIFPSHVSEVFSHMNMVLESGPRFHKPGILAIIHALLVHIDIDKLDHKAKWKASKLLHSVSRLICGDLAREATAVLDVAIASIGIKDPRSITSLSEPTTEQVDNFSDESGHAEVRHLSPRSAQRESDLKERASRALFGKDPMKGYKQVVRALGAVLDACPPSRVSPRKHRRQRSSFGLPVKANHFEAYYQGESEVSSPKQEDATELSMDLAEPEVEEAESRLRELLGEYGISTEVEEGETIDDEEVHEDEFSKAPWEERSPLRPPQTLSGGRDFETNGRSLEIDEALSPIPAAERSTNGEEEVDEYSIRKERGVDAHEARELEREEESVEDHTPASADPLELDDEDDIQEIERALERTLGKGPSALTEKGRGSKDAGFDDEEDSD